MSGPPYYDPHDRETNAVFQHLVQVLAVRRLSIDDPIDYPPPVASLSSMFKDKLRISYAEFDGAVESAVESLVGGR